MHCNSVCRSICHMKHLYPDIQSKFCIVSVNIERMICILPTAVISSRVARYALPMSIFESAMLCVIYSLQ